MATRGARCPRTGCGSGESGAGRRGASSGCVGLAAGRRDGGAGRSGRVGASAAVSAAPGSRPGPSGPAWRARRKERLPASPELERTRPRRPAGAGERGLPRAPLGPRPLSSAGPRTCPPGAPRTGPRCRVPRAGKRGPYITVGHRAPSRARTPPSAPPPRAPAPHWGALSSFGLGSARGRPRPGCRGERLAPFALPCDASLFVFTTFAGDRRRSGVRTLPAGCGRPVFPGAILELGCAGRAAPEVD